MELFSSQNNKTTAKTSQLSLHLRFYLYSLRSFDFYLKEILFLHIQNLRDTDRPDVSELTGAREAPGWYATVKTIAMFVEIQSAQKIDFIPND